jgi:diguanylate cyclase (GGDEF)-like protein
MNFLPYATGLSSPLLHVSLFGMPVDKANEPVEPVIGQAVGTHLHLLEPWQMNTSTWQDSATGLGGLSVVTGTASLLLAFLVMRLRNLKNHLRDREQQVEAILGGDPLTGLANRRQLDQLGTRLLRQQPNTEVSLLYINVNRFKAINEELGYSAGDELLCALSRRLQTCLSTYHTLARIGSDEFAMLLAGETSLSVRQVAKRVLAVFSQPFYIQGQSVMVSGSLGIAQTNVVSQHQQQSAQEGSGRKGSGQDVWIEGNAVRPTCCNEMLIQAGIAMSKAKIAQSMLQKGRQYHPSHYVVFHPVMLAEVRSQATLQRALAQALQRQELRVHYQPIVDLRNSRPVGFEALVRWQHPKQGLLAPGDFLPLAEEMGLIVAIDRQVMQIACQQLVMWQRQLGGMRPSLSVNLSGIHLDRPDLVNYIQLLLKRYPIAPQQLNLEVTESVMIADPQRAIATLRQIRALGLSVSLDDFGTGYSSLSYLHQLPVDILKIDRFFVRSLCESEASGPETSEPETSRPGGSDQSLTQPKVILASIVELAAKLNMRVVAEGIESPAQLHELRQMHCTYGQGNYFSKPVSALSAQAVLRSSQPWSRQVRTSPKAV